LFTTIPDLYIYIHDKFFYIDIVMNLVAVAYPPSMTMEKQGPLPAAPLGYPTSAVPENQVPAKTQSRGDDFWKGW
jgi:hypothetical protein